MNLHIALFRLNPLRFSLGIICLGSAAALASAWIAQYGLGLRPCELCVLQRYPYMALVIISAAAWLFPRSTKTARVIVAICGLLLLGEAGLAGYHAGVEKGIFAGPSACAGESERGMSLEALRAQIMGSQVVACNTPAIEFMGLTMASANMFYALLLAWICVVGMRRDGAAT